MNPAKIEFKVGLIHFVGEGDKEWVGKQLDKILLHAPKLLETQPELTEEGIEIPKITSGKSKGTKGKTLAVYLKETNSLTNQVKKFLATAIWVKYNQSKTKISTADVTKALKDAHQSKLGNPSDCLNQNIKKGFGEKDGKDFFITTDGEDSLKV